MVSLFDSVAVVQRQLEASNISHYDVNRIYNLLEDQLDNEDRVNAVVAQIIRDVGADDIYPFDYLSSPEQVDFDRDEDVNNMEVVLAGPPPPGFGARGDLAFDEGASTSAQSPVAIWEQNNGDNDPNNNDPNNNIYEEPMPQNDVAALEPRVECAGGGSVADLLRETTAITDFVTSFSFTEVYELLVQHKDKPNRRQFVAHLCLKEELEGRTSKAQASSFPKSSQSQRIGQWHHPQKDIQTLKRNVPKNALTNGTEPALKKEKMAFHSTSSVQSNVIGSSATSTVVRESDLAKVAVDNSEVYPYSITNGLPLTNHTTPQVASVEVADRIPDIVHTPDDQSNAVNTLQKLLSSEDSDLHVELGASSSSSTRSYDHANIPFIEVSSPSFEETAASGQPPQSESKHDSLDVDRPLDTEHGVKTRVNLDFGESMVPKESWRKWEPDSSDDEPSAKNWCNPWKRPLNGPQEPVPSDSGRHEVDDITLPSSAETESSVIVQSVKVSFKPSTSIEIVDDGPSTSKRPHLCVTDNNLNWRARPKQTQSDSEDTSDSDVEAKSRSKSVKTKPIESKKDAGGSKPHGGGKKSHAGNNRRKKRQFTIIEDDSDSDQGKFIRPRGSAKDTIVQLDDTVDLDGTVDLDDSACEASSSTKQPTNDATAVQLDAHDKTDQPGPLSSKIKQVQNPHESMPSTSKENQVPLHKHVEYLKKKFPGIDIDFLDTFCKGFDASVPLTTLVSHLLCTQDVSTDAANEVIAVNETEETDPLLGEAFQSIQDILPDADPNYLHEKFTEMAGNEDAIKAFVSNALELRNYPTRQQSMQKQNELKLVKQLTDNFNIQEFLGDIPDPFTFFSLEGGKTVNDRETDRGFLYNRYLQHSGTVIEKAYVKHKDRLYPTCKALDKIKNRGKHPNREWKNYRQINSTPFLQEVAFINNEEAIKKFIKKRDTAKKKSFESAKAKGELLTCQCCFDDEVLLENMAACDDGHLFCKECIRRGVETLIGQGKTKFPCFMECVANFSFETLKPVLKPSVFTNLVNRSQLEEVKAAGIEDLETCPFCDFSMIPLPNDKIFTCLNPTCMKQSCRLCKEINHIPLRCDEVEKSDEVKARTFIEDRMTKALIRTCWKCGKKFIKEDGCNKMTCTCGAQMCYICRQPVTNYSHFNGQGGLELHKCPLFTNNDLIHVNDVEAEAKKAKEEMEALNPTITLKHDPTKILPQARNPVNHLNILGEDDSEEDEDDGDSFDSDEHERVLEDYMDSDDDVRFYYRRHRYDFHERDEELEEEGEEEEDEDEDVEEEEEEYYEENVNES